MPGRCYKAVQDSSIFESVERCLFRRSSRTGGFRLSQMIRLLLLERLLGLIDGFHLVLVCSLDY